MALLEAERLGSKRVLDVGCGWGRLTLALAGKAAWAVGLDRDAASIREGRARAAAAGLAKVEYN
jgi:cyclopropane fatty-acyl-phospholipid synthase-like methyltransferase